MSPVPVAFYAPLKSPDHPVPSGDRTMARLLVAALTTAGFAPGLASGLRAYEPTGEAARQREAKERAAREIERLRDVFAHTPAPSRPRLWFTYHPYYKAPDRIGPALAATLGIPYVAAEASRADTRADGPWAEAHLCVEAALARAAVLFAVTPLDRAALERRRPPGQRIVDLPPFVGAEALQPPRPPRLGTEGRVRLLTVAMMRAGDKLASYRLLAESLARLGGAAWELDIVGDGPARAEVEALFRPFGDQVRCLGRIDDRDALAPRYRAADLLVWPAVNEAYGMVLLEAQAAGCPVLAGDFGGVASVMQPGRSGVLTRPGDADAFAMALRALIDDPARRAGMSAAATQFVGSERSLDVAAGLLWRTLAPLLSAPAEIPP